MVNLTNVIAIIFAALCGSCSLIYHYYNYSFEKNTDNVTGAHDMVPGLGLNMTSSEQLANNDWGRVLLRSRVLRSINVAQALP